MGVDGSGRRDYFGRERQWGGREAERMAVISQGEGGLGGAGGGGGEAGVLRLRT